MRRIVVMALGPLAACEPAPDTQDHAAQDARDIAFVENVQKQLPTLVPVQPQPIMPADVATTGMAGAGCSYRAGSGDAAPILLSSRDKGFVKLDGKLLTLAADTGSPEFPAGTRGRFMGLKFSVVLTRSDGEAGHDGPTTITLRDAYDRVIFQSAGTLECGAAA